MHTQLNIKSGAFKSAVYQVTKMLTMKEPHTALFVYE